MRNADLAVIVMSAVTSCNFSLFISPSFSIRPYKFLSNSVLSMDLFTDLSAASASASGGFSGCNQRPTRKGRAACDRGHSQKLRCVRRTDQDSCERCLKLKTSCRFGPRSSRASLKPREQAAGCAYEAFISTPNVYSDPVVANVSDDD